MTCPMTNTTFNIARLWNIQDGTTDSAEFDIIDSKYSSSQSFPRIWTL